MFSGLCAKTILLINYNELKTRQSSLFSYSGLYLVRRGEQVSLVARSDGLYSELAGAKFISKYCVTIEKKCYNLSFGLLGKYFSVHVLRAKTNLLYRGRAITKERLKCVFRDVKYPITDLFLLFKHK